ncbi:TIGR02680 family protein [Lentzea sp. NPDC034063]|uniref:TIGR02680 family protein n=1 Tax=unclassified Lentzea TaxID=2643253 RepID=UPI0033C0AB77
MTIDEASESGSRDGDPFTGLPQPSRTRFQPMRTGLLGMWQYSEQEFRFHDGRLILHGRNGSGKTKVLEVTSPFLFDANLTTQRLDPFGSKARPMRENLLHGGRTSQIGYVWCEYGRLAKDGSVEFVTIGAGMKAWESQKGAPESWYFVTDQRVGADFRLYDSQRHQHTEATLTQVLGPDSVFTQAGQYRRQVADRLFGLSAERLRSLVELLLVLRRPKLSENLDVEKLATILSEGLPPVDEDIVDKMAQGFDDLSNDQEELLQLETAYSAVSHFLDAYRAYATTTSRFLADKVVAANKEHNAALGNRRDATSAVEAADTELQQIEDKAEKKRTQKLKLDERWRVLHDSPEVGEIRDLEQLWTTILDQKSTAKDAERQAGQAAKRATDAADQFEEKTKAEKRSLANLADLMQRTGLQADQCGLSVERAEWWPRWESDVDGPQRALEAAAALRRNEVVKARQLINAYEELVRAHDRVQDQHDACARVRDEARQQVKEQETSVSEQVQLVCDAVLAWAEHCEECIVDDDAVDIMLDAVENLGDESRSPLAQLVNTHVARAEARLTEQRTRIELQGEQLTLAREAALREHERVAAQKFPERPRPLVPRRADEDRDAGGAPLWKLVDFADHLTDGERDGLEAALLGAGLLDAWVTPDGELLDADTWETVVLPDTRDRSLSLANAVTVSEGFGVSGTAISAVLNSIGYLQDNATLTAQPWLTSTGAWQLGPLHGQTGEHRASYIGERARTQARHRRLAEIDDETTSLDSALAAVVEAQRDVTERRHRLQQEQKAQPTDEPLRTALTHLEAAAAQLRKREVDVQKKRAELDAAAEAFNEERSTLERYGTEHTVPIRAAGLDALNDSLNEFGVALAQLANRADGHRRCRIEVDTATRRVKELREEAVPPAEAARAAADRLLELETEHETRSSFLGASAQDVLAELERTSGDLRVIMESLTSLAKRRDQVFSERGKAEGRLESLADEVTRTEKELGIVATAFRRACDGGVLRLTADAELSSNTSPTDIGQTVALTRKVERRFRDLNITDAERNNVRNEVDNQFRHLQLELADPMWKPWGSYDGEIFLVQITFRESDHEVPQLLDLLANEISTRKTYIHEEERKLFSEVLLGSVGEHLRLRRRDAKRLKDRINKQLEEHATASKVTLQLEWKPVDEGGPDMEEALKLLDAGATTFLDDKGREALVRFLSARIEDVRSDQRADWRKELAKALDYRSWCRFELQVKTEGRQRYTKLTDELHRKGSGGEKAVMLQLPLFAAAAAHYTGADPKAPRPVYLDEAFAGVDTEMRASCMGLLTELDLDFVMASHDEWGFHKTVPGVATYQLYRDPAIEGVLTTPIFWDGIQQHEREDPAVASPVVTPTLEWGQK